MKKLMRKKLALMLANLKKERKYYCEVEYLEGTGTQYIITDIYPTANYTYEATVSTATGRCAFFGVRKSGTSTSNNKQCILYVNTSAQTTLYQRIRFLTTAITSGSNWNSGIVPTVDTPYHFKNITTVSTMEDMTYPMQIFGYNEAGTPSDSEYNACRIYNLKVYDNGVLIADFIPVLDWEYVPCLYDKVKDKLYYNRGTGDFSYGREIHQIEYIKGTGTQYFDSGVATSTTIISECTCQYDPDETYITSVIFGSGTTTDVNNDRYQAIFSTAGMAYSARLDGGTRVLSNLNVRVKRTVKVDPIAKRFYVDNKNDALGYSGSLNSNNIYFFVRSMDEGETMPTPTSMWFYDAKMWDDTELVRDFIPAVDEDGIAFAFDNVEHLIHDNIGTGYFEYPDVELEYLESTGYQYIETGVYFDVTKDLRIKTKSTSLTTGRSIIASSYYSSGYSAFGLEYGASGNAGSVRVYFSSKQSTPAGGYTENLTIGKPVELDCSYVYADKNIHLKYNNSEVDYTTNEGTLTAHNDIRLFLDARQSPSALRNGIRIYYMEIIKEGVSQCNYVPVIHNGTFCMYDKVSETYFTNQGTGNFSGKIKETK